MRKTLGTTMPTIKIIKKNIIFRMFKLADMIFAKPLQA